MTGIIDELISTHMQIWQIMSKKSHISVEERTATMLQFHVLRFIKQNINVTVGDFADKMHLSISSATQLIERLTKAKYIVKIVDAADRRVIHLSITKEGETELERIAQAVKERMGKILAQIPKDDLQHLLRINKSLLDKLKKQA